MFSPLGEDHLQRFCGGSSSNAVKWQLLDTDKPDGLELGGQLVCS